MQLLLEALLNAELADVLGAAVVALILVRPFLDDLLLGLVDPADVANHMAGQLAPGVVAEQPRLDLHAGEAEALRRKLGHFLIGQAGADRQRVDALGLLAQLLEATPVARRDVQHLGQLLDGLLDVGHLGRADLQRVGRVIGGQHDAVAVQDQAAVGHHRHDGGTVGLGLGIELVMPDHLQVDQPHRQQAEARQHDGRDHQHAGTKA